MRDSGAELLLGSAAEAALMPSRRSQDLCESSEYTDVNTHAEPSLLEAASAEPLLVCGCSSFRSGGCSH